MHESIATASISYGNSVCPSVMTRYQYKTRWDRDFGFSQYDSLLSLSISWQNFILLGKGDPFKWGGERRAPP